MANIHTATRQRRISKILDTLDAASRQPAPALPAEGIVTWETLQHFVPWSQRNTRRMVLAGRFPPGTEIGGYTCWRAEAIRKWLNETLPLIAE